MPGKGEDEDAPVLGNVHEKTSCVRQSECSRAVCVGGWRHRLCAPCALGGTDHEVPIALDCGTRNKGGLNSATRTMEVRPRRGRWCTRTKQSTHSERPLNCVVKERKRFLTQSKTHMQRHDVCVCELDAILGGARHDRPAPPSWDTDIDVVSDQQ